MSLCHYSFNKIIHDYNHSWIMIIYRDHFLSISYVTKIFLLTLIVLHNEYKYMICHWPCLKHPFEHHGLVILGLLYPDVCNMLCTMEFCHPKQILLSHTTLNYIAKPLLSDNKEHSSSVRKKVLFSGIEEKDKVERRLAVQKIVN